MFSTHCFYALILECLSWSCKVLNLLLAIHFNARVTFLLRVQKLRKMEIVAALIQDSLSGNKIKSVSLVCFDKKWSLNWTSAHLYTTADNLFRASDGLATPISFSQKRWPNIRWTVWSVFSRAMRHPPAKYFATWDGTSVGWRFL